MIKNLLILIMCIISSSVGISQINKSDTYLGGTLSFNSYSENGGRNNSDGSISLALGKAFKTNKIIGIKFGLDLFENPNPNPSSSHGYGHFYNFGIFYKDYRNIASKLQFFTESGIGYYSGITHFPSINPQSFVSNGGFLYLNTGLSYQLYKKLRLELALPNLLRADYHYVKYTGSSNSTTYNNTTKNLTISTGLSNAPLSSLSLGFNIIF